MKPDGRQLAKYMGRRLREERRALGQTQEEFAGLLGITQGQLSRLEKGTRQISAALVLELSRRLDLPVGSLFPPPKDGEVEDSEALLLEAWRARDFAQLLELVTQHMRGDAKSPRPRQRANKHAKKA